MIWIFTEGEGDEIKFRLPIKTFSILIVVIVVPFFLAFQLFKVTVLFFLKVDKYVQYVIGIICVAQKWEITVCYQGRVLAAQSNSRRRTYYYWLDSIFITLGNVYIRHVYSSAQGGYGIWWWQIIACVNTKVAHFSIPYENLAYVIYTLLCK